MIDSSIRLTAPFESAPWACAPHNCIPSKSLCGLDFGIEDRRFCVEIDGSEYATFQRVILDGHRACICFPRADKCVNL